MDSLLRVSWRETKQWQIKKSLSALITNSTIEEIYYKGIQAGAIGGKLLGAGAGGFMLFYANEEYHKKIIETLKDLLHVPFKFEENGSIILYKH